MNNIWHFDVRSFDCGRDGELRLPRLLDFLQETASEHARLLGFDFPVFDDATGERGAWVLSQLRLRLDSPARWRDTLTVATVPWGVRALTANRDFTVTLPGGVPCARATTRWALMSPKTRRVVRIPAFVGAFSFEREPLFGEAPDADPFSRLRWSEPHGCPCATSSHRAEKGHIDLNGHVNNTVYAAWLLESIPDEAVRGMRLAEMELSFRSETLLGDAVESVTAEEAPGRFLHCVRAPGGAEHVVGRTIWQTA